MQINSVIDVRLCSSNAYFHHSVKRFSLAKATCFQLLSVTASEAQHVDEDGMPSVVLVDDPDIAMPLQDGSMPKDITHDERAAMLHATATALDSASRENYELTPRHVLARDRLATSRGLAIFSPVHSTAF